MKNLLKKENAITLIALVITIVVLLILAGITIAQLTGNGIFDKAKTAKEVSENAQDDENEKMAKYNNEIDNFISSNRNFTPISYSTEEQDTGLKWVDGKTIYQKSFNVSFTWTSSRTWVNPSPIDLTSLNPEMVIKMDGVVDAFGQIHRIPYIDNSTCYVDYFYQKNTHKISIVTSGGDNTTATGVFTIQYTKTTD